MEAIRLKRMNMKYKFNDDKIILGYLELIMEQRKIASSDKIVVGREGGIAYSLFHNKVSDLKQEFEIRTTNSWKAANDYIESVNKYLFDCHVIGYDYGMDLMYGVTVFEERPVIRKYERANDFFYEVLLGIDKINSFSEIDGFLDMIEQKGKDIEKKYLLLHKALRSISKQY